MAFLPGKRLRRAGLSRWTAIDRLTTVILLLSLVTLARFTLHVPNLAAQMQSDNKPSESGAVPPKSWIDKDTGHRVWRVSDEPNSGAFYFNVNAFTPDTSRWCITRPMEFACSTWRR